MSKLPKTNASIPSFTQIRFVGRPNLAVVVAHMILNRIFFYSQAVCEWRTQAHVERLKRGPKLERDEVFLGL